METGTRSTSTSPSAEKDKFPTTLIIAAALIIGSLLFWGLCALLTAAGMYAYRLENPSGALACPTPPQGWKLFTLVDFSGSSPLQGQTWLTSGDDEAGWYLQDGVYQGEIAADTDFFQFVYNDALFMDDIYYSADAELVDGAEDDFYGLMYHYSHGNATFFLVSETQEYAVLLFQGEWTALVPWTSTDLIKTGEANHLTVISNEDRQTFCINGRWVKSLVDDSQPKGHSGFAMGTSSSGELVMKFDNFTLTVPVATPTPAATPTSPGQ
jgi:hypothetical protein